jgi:hypothetical protein
VPPGEKAQPVRRASPVATVWDGAGVLVDLGHVRAVERLVFELDERPWIPAPQLHASTDGRVWEALGARASLADATASLYEDPRTGRGAVRFSRVRARFLRVDPHLPSRAVAFEADPP